MSRNLRQKLGFALLSLVTIIVVLPILWVVGYIVVQGAPAISWEFISAMPRDGMRAGGVWPAIVGTVLLTLGTAIFAVPLGVAVAIYLAEYASARVRATAKPLLEVLARRRPDVDDRPRVVQQRPRGPDARHH